MYFSKQTIALTMIVSTLSGALTFTVSPQAEAQVVRQGRSDRTIVAPAVEPLRPLRLTAPISLSGNWQGNIHSSGDDVLTHLTLQITASGSGYQGNWQLHGQAGVLQQGSLNASKQGNAITLALEGFNGNQPIVLTGTIGSGGTTMSGQIVNSSFVFLFTKS
ncbi:hypothetical protein IQ268_30755 [Oculatella sp. LEGE 06141]|uniref:hypothetical protein n=1 Tax=Oculatella sp. LEGE 06141 TaxID=1828648 RepID=UPI00187EFDF6|nr:hypothetical protein [Oculatella sp. LEGE 06141]MBE9182919.1 hypothetical protein [Oculatella sp. LEGE 06141]